MNPIIVIPLMVLVGVFILVWAIRELERDEPDGYTVIGGIVALAIGFTTLGGFVCYESPKQTEIMYVQIPVVQTYCPLAEKPDVVKVTP